MLALGSSTDMSEAAHSQYHGQASQKGMTKPLTFQ